MAQGLETRRHDIRLDTFLRRNLSQEEFERVSTSEPCVITSPEEKRVHRHLILGHNRLYTTEFPPKNLKTVLKLKDLISISLLKDLPDFLSGKEQQNTIHIRLSYQRPTKEKTSFLSSLGNKKSPIRKERNRPDPPRTTAGKEVGEVTARLSLSSTQINHRRISHPPNPIICGISVDGGSVGGKAPKNPQGMGLGSRSKFEIAHHGKRSVLECDDDDDDDDDDDGDDDDESKRTTSSPCNVRITPKMQVKLKSVGSMKTMIVPSSSSSCMAIMKKDRTHSQPDLKEYPLLQDHSEAFSLSSGGISSGSLSRELGSTRCSSKDVAVVDVYILNQATDFYHRLKATWEGIKLNQVLEQPGFCFPGIPKAKSYDQFWQHFSTLKEDFLSSQKLEKLAELAQELSTACQKYFILKKMFWEDSDLLEFCIKKLKLYLLGWRSHMGALDDCIEYSIILLDLLYQMLKETHILQKKLVYLTRNNGHSLLSLTRTITHTPPSIDHTQKEELMEKACAVLYELLLVVKQSHWPSANKTNISTSCLVESLITSSGNPSLFFGSAVNYASQILSHDLHPQEQVTLYQLSFVLCSFLESSPSLIQLFRKHFTEEVRYYISLARAEQRLPPHSQLTRKTLEMLQKINSRVNK